MKRKKIFLGLVLFAMVMGITACSMSKDDTSETQIMQPESISAEKENDGQEKAGSHDIQVGVEREDENKGTEVQQSEKQELQQPERQQVQNEADADLEERLAQYREERESMTNVAMGNGVSGYGAPNAENFGFQADTADYMQNFDSRELNKAYETAKKYVTETLKISVETNAVVYPCIDPGITEIYEAEDKGVADGYDSENIFVCEYCDNGNWQYLILVRDGKDSDWSVIHYGGSYKE